ncbi:ndufa8, NADH-ubiquinone oxidoreductase complex I 19kd subunit [Savitreella phatthalungensis]
MTTYKEPRFNQSSLVDSTPLPSSIPAVDEVGATSAPLKSAAFALGERCGSYGQDFMACKAEAGARGEASDAACLFEGRRVTRCATETLSLIKKNCAEEFLQHWTCLDLKNQEYANCRPKEAVFNKCLFDTMGLKKQVPGTKEGQEPWLKKNRIFKPFTEDYPAPVPNKSGA